MLLCRISAVTCFLFFCCAAQSPSQKDFDRPVNAFSMTTLKFQRFISCSTQVMSVESQLRVSSIPVNVVDSDIAGLRLAPQANRADALRTDCRTECTHPANCSRRTADWRSVRTCIQASYGCVVHEHAATHSVQSAEWSALQRRYDFKCWSSECRSSRATSNRCCCRADLRICAISWGKIGPICRNSSFTWGKIGPSLCSIDSILRWWKSDALVAEKIQRNPTGTRIPRNQAHGPSIMA